MTAPTTELFSDLPQALRGPARTHGRAMVALVYGAGMASEAMSVLGKRVASQRDSSGLRAVQVLSGVFNETSTAYCKAMGWTEEGLALCDRDIQLAFQAKIITPASIIQLNS